MNTIAKMTEYVQNAQVSLPDHYDIVLGEVKSLKEAIHAGDIFDSIMLAFNYGAAKGYRLAKEEVLNK